MEVSRSFLQSFEHVVQLQQQMRLVFGLIINLCQAAWYKMEQQAELLKYARNQVRS